MIFYIHRLNVLIRSSFCHENILTLKVINDKRVIASTYQAAYAGVAVRLKLIIEANYSEKILYIMRT